MNFNYDITLSKKANCLLGLLYSVYQNRIESGSLISDAKWFGDAPSLRDTLKSDWSCEDITDICAELANCGYIESALFANDEIDQFVLSNKAIAYMDNTLLRNAISLCDFILHFK